MQSCTLIFLAAVVALALAEGQFYVPRAYYIIDSEGHESPPVPLRRLRRSLASYTGYGGRANADAHANANSWGGDASATANANANAGPGDKQGGSDGPGASSESQLDEADLHAWYRPGSSGYGSAPPVYRH